MIYLGYIYAFCLTKRHYSPVHLVFKSLCALGSPGQPELEDVVVSAALDHLVAGVIRDVVVLVLLEQVAGLHRVAVSQNTLNILNCSFSRGTPSLDKK